MADLRKKNVDSVNRLAVLPLQGIIVILVLLALQIDVYAIVSGLNEPVLDYSNYSPEGYKKFFQVPAWFPFPLFFILVYFVVRQSWEAFNVAWLHLPETDVLQHCKKGPKVEDKVVHGILSQFNRWRVNWLIPLSLLAGFLCMYMDSERERDTMLIGSVSTDPDHVDAYQEPKTTLAGQVARACESPDFMSKWLWEKLANAKVDATEICSLNELKEKYGKDKVIPREAQYNHRRDKAIAAFKGNKDISNSFSKPPNWQWGPIFLMQLENAILISIGWLIFFQCIAHPVFFWCFERFDIAENQGKPLCIRLNSQSALGEFGLQHWNHALNNLYWFFSLGLLIPIFSRISQPDLKDLDFSQVVLQLAMPVLVAIPMITTILSRQNRLPACWETLSDADALDYKKQRLWPLDENWSSKLGVVLAFVILSISFGYNLVTLI